MRAKPLNQVLCNQLAHDVLEELEREPATTKELHGRLQPRWADAHYVQLGIYQVQNMVNSLYAANLIRSCGPNMDLYCMVVQP